MAASPSCNDIGSGTVFDGVGANGTAGQDSLSGGGGNDTLFGGVGDDTLNGGGSADTLDGGLGADTMSGGAGNDTYIVDNVGDQTIEQAGNGNDSVQTTLNTYSFTPTTGMDNMMFIGSGSFTGTGNINPNIMVGGTGNDRLTGAANQDTLTGGLGDDTFVYTATADSGVGAAARDVIIDFNTGNDTIDLSAIAGTFVFIGNAAFAASNVNQVRFSTTLVPGSTLIQIDNDGDNAAEAEILLLGYVAPPAAPIVAADFVL